MKRLTRREFLKLAAALSAGAALPRIFSGPGLASTPAAGHKPNVILLLFDAMSARHLSVYGYARETTPNLARFAQRATLYHAHTAAGKFTSPSTASLLTGVYPWKHRAFNRAGLIERSLLDANLFNLVGGEYRRLIFPQNLFVDVQAGQIARDIDVILPPTAFSLGGDDLVLDKLNDRALALHAFEDHLLALSPFLPGSLLAGYLKTINSLRKSEFYRSGLPDYPRGAPALADYNIAFKLETVFQGVQSTIGKLRQDGKPYFAYFHLYPPHEPYKPQVAFNKHFEDDFHPVEKPLHPLAEGFACADLLEKRRLYDRFIASLDAEFGRLFDSLESAGALENTWLVVTSDHGQMFERGDHGHGTPLLYEPVIHIPLLVSGPGQAGRQDVYQPTSSVDLLPAILSLLGKSAPAGLDGRLLPAPEDVESGRSVYALQAAANSAFRPLTTATVCMRKGGWKLIHYRGYPGFENAFECYDLQADPEELVDLYKSGPPQVVEMKSELLALLEQADRPYLP